MAEGRGRGKCTGGGQDDEDSQFDLSSDFSSEENDGESASPVQAAGMFAHHQSSCLDVSHLS